MFFGELIRQENGFTIMRVREATVLILGGGISGLCVGYRLNQLGIPFKLLEAASRVGGKIQTVQANSFQLEHGPNSIMLKPGPIMDLIEDLGLESKLVYPHQRRPARYICDGTNLHKISPTSLFPYLGLSTSMRLVVGGYSSKATKDETVAEFFTRKFGRSFVDKLVSPFVAGIYAGDVEKLMMAQAFPKIWDMDRSYNSLWLAQLLGDQKTLKKGRLKSGIVTFKGGLEELTNRLRDRMAGSIELESEVAKLHFEDLQWTVSTSKANYKSTYLVSALPAPTLSKLLTQDHFSSLRSHLENLSYPWMRVLHIAYPQADFGNRIAGFGFLNEPKADLPFLGCLYSSQLFAHRSSSDEVFLTIFLGGEIGQDLRDLSVEESVAKVHASLKLILKLKSDTPKLLGFRDWEHSIPQYDQYQCRLEKLLQTFDPAKYGIFLGSNFLGGISVPQCVNSSFRIAKDLGAILQNRLPTT